jgi:hypothetical protein
MAAYPKITTNYQRKPPEGGYLIEVFGCGAQFSSNFNAVPALKGSLLKNRNEKVTNNCRAQLLSE